LGLKLAQLSGGREVKEKTFRKEKIVERNSDVCEKNENKIKHFL
jgi:hypothetical protein